MINRDDLLDRITRKLESAYPNGYTANDMRLAISNPGESITQRRINAIMSRACEEGTLEIGPARYNGRKIYMRKPAGYALDLPQAHWDRNEIYGYRPMKQLFSAQRPSRFDYRGPEGNSLGLIRK